MKKPKKENTRNKVVYIRFPVEIKDGYVEFPKKVVWEVIKNE